MDLIISVCIYIYNHIYCTILYVYSFETKNDDNYVYIYIHIYIYIYTYVPGYMDLAYGHMIRKQLDRGLGIYMSIRCPSSAAQAIHHLIPRPPLARPPAAPNGGFETGISWATEESSTSLLQTYV